MKTNKTFEIEISRSNVTPAQFLSYVRRSVDRKGGEMLRGDLGLAYFAAGNDLNFDIHHEEPEFDGLHEKSVSKPYEMQTYLRYSNGAVYNEICEFTFDDEKTGHGYYYLVEVFPIRGKIRHIRMYKQYRESWYDVVYTSGRIVTYTEPYLPTTAAKFIDSSEIRIERGGEMFYY